MCVAAYNKTYHTARYANDPAFRRRTIENARQWAKANPEKRSAIAIRRNKKEKLKCPDKVKCRALVNQRVRKGRMVAAKFLQCQCCGEWAHHYHHYRGYEFKHRYDVIPLCAKCHKVIDRAEYTPNALRQDASIARPTRSSALQKSRQPSAVSCLASDRGAGPAN